MLGVLKLLVGPVTSLFAKRSERKQLKQEAEYKLARGEQVSKAEWEAMGVQAGMDSWKDEYVTIIVTLPIPYIFIGNTVSAFSGDTRILEANSAALQELGILMDTTYGQLVFAVCLAAIGLKSLKGIMK